MGQLNAHPCFAEKGLDSTHKVTKATGMSWNMIESIASGKTRMPRDKTIQKLMTITGLSRAQYGAHTRVVNALHAEVDKSVTAKAVRSRQPSHLPSLMRLSLPTKPQKLSAN